MICEALPGLANSRRVFCGLILRDRELMEAFNVASSMMSMPTPSVAKALFLSTNSSIFLMAYTASGAFTPKEIKPFKCPMAWFTISLRELP